MGHDQSDMLIAELSADCPDKAKLAAINSLRVLGLDKKIPTYLLKHSPRVRMATSRASPNGSGSEITSCSSRASCNGNIAPGVGHGRIHHASILAKNRAAPSVRAGRRFTMTGTREVDDKPQWR